MTAIRLLFYIFLFLAALFPENTWASEKNIHKLIESGDLQEALKMISVKKAEGRMNARALYDLALSESEIYLRMGKIDAILSPLFDAKQQIHEPSMIAALNYKIAQYAYYMGLYSYSTFFLTDLINTHTIKATHHIFRQAVELLATIYVKLGFYQEAENLVRSSSFPEHKFIFAYLKYLQGHYDEAYTLFTNLARSVGDRALSQKCIAHARLCLIEQDPARLLKSSAERDALYLVAEFRMGAKDLKLDVERKLKSLDVSIPESDQFVLYYIAASLESAGGSKAKALEYAEKSVHHLERIRNREYVGERIDFYMRSTLGIGHTAPYILAGKIAYDLGKYELVNQYANYMQNRVFQDYLLLKDTKSVELSSTEQLKSAKAKSLNTQILACPRIPFDRIKTYLDQMTSTIWGKSFVATLYTAYYGHATTEHARAQISSFPKDFYARLQFLNESGLSNNLTRHILEETKERK